MIYGGSSKSRDLANTKVQIEKIKTQQNEVYGQNIINPEILAEPKVKIAISEFNVPV